MTHTSTLLRGLFASACLALGLFVAAPVSHAADTVPPVITLPSNTTVPVGSSFSIRATVTDDQSGIKHCFASVNGIEDTDKLPLVSTMILGRVYARDHLFDVLGQYLITVRCLDTADNQGVSATWQVNTIPAPDGAPAIPPPVFDASGPILTANGPSSITVGETARLSVGYSDASGVVSCRFLLNGSVASVLPTSGTAGTLEVTYTSPVSETATYGFDCTDVYGNVGISPVLTLVVSAPPADITPPSIGTLTPAATDANVPTLIQVPYADNAGVTQCQIVFAGGGGNMQLASATNGIASYQHTFTTAGTVALTIMCRDAAGSTTIASSSIVVRPVTVPTPTPPTPPATPVTPTAPPATGTSQPTTPSPSTSPSTARLIKLACPNTPVAADHPCKAVYYYGSSGKRHAFPNAQVYFTWYNDFLSVQEVSPSFIASIPLGRNVRYRAGVRMVKFTTLNRVYAVSRAGTLRWVTTEEVARALYGSTWARQIDDISDVFFTDYTFGADITASSQYNAANELAQTSSINLDW